MLYNRPPCILLLPLLLSGMFSFATGSIAAQENPFDKAERLRMQQFADKICMLAGEGWSVDLERITALQGWTGRVNGYAFHFRHQTKTVPGQENVPVTFRVTVTNFDRDIHPQDPATVPPNMDIFLGNSITNLWYIATGTYQKVYPQEWDALLEKIRESFCIPKAVDGIQCLLESSKDIFMEGEPISIWVRVYNTLPQAISIPDVRDQLLEHFELKDSTDHIIPLNQPLSTAFPAAQQYTLLAFGGWYFRDAIPNKRLLAPAKYTNGYLVRRP